MRLRFNKRYAALLLALLLTLTITQGQSAVLSLGSRGE